jgi:DNA-binding PadR family transcriptional regulator
LLILTVLADGPKHGYEIIKEIERRSKGAYTPSPGTIYPTLQMLEDMGYASSHAQEERRVYEITEDGRSYVNERETSVGEAWGRFEGWDWRHLFGTDDQRQVQRELLDLGRALFAGGRILRADARMLQEVRAALRQAREKIEGTLNATGVRDGQTN